MDAFNSKIYKQGYMLYNMKYITILLVLLLFIPMVYSAQESLGIVKQNECVRLYQTCASCSEISLSSIIYPSKVVANSSIVLTTDDNFEYYTDFCQTQQLGQYIVNGKADVDGTDTPFAYDFEVTTNGNAKPSEILLVVYTILFIVIFFFSLFYFFKALEHVIQLDMDLYDTIILIGSYLSIWIFYYFSQEYLGNSFVNEILELSITIGAFTHVFLPIVGFLVSFIMTNLKLKQKAQVTY